MRQDDVVKRLDYKPGDIIVVTTPDRLAPDAHARMKNGIEKLLPGAKVLILDDGVQLTIVAKETIHGGKKES